MVSTIDYLNLSALSYGDFTKETEGKSVGYIIDKKLFSNNLKLLDSGLSALKSSSSPLRSWKLIAQSPSSVSEVKVVNYRGYKRKEVVTRSIPFSCAAFQNPETGEIIFSFKGTDFDPSNPKTYTDTAKDITNTDGQIFTGSSNYVNENGFIGNTWNRLRGAILCSL